MAYYAKIGSGNVVTNVVRIPKIQIMNEDWEEDDAKGLSLCEDATSGTYVRCSYNTSKGVHSKGGTALRANFPAPGMIYDSTNVIFLEPRPTDIDSEACTSWTLSTTTGLWSPPIVKPTSPAETETSWYVWDLSLIHI